MWSMRRKKSKRTFLLLEVLLSMTLVVLALPFFIKDAELYKKKVKELEFYNEFESAFKREVFFLYDSLYQEPYFQKIDRLSSGDLHLEYKKLHIQNKVYPLVLDLHKKKVDDKNQNDQLSLILKADHLPLSSSTYASNVQNIYLKK